MAKDDLNSDLFANQEFIEWLKNKYNIKPEDVDSADRDKFVREYRVAKESSPVISAETPEISLDNAQSDVLVRTDEEVRIRSPFSDYNEVMLDAYRTEYLRSENLLTQEEINAIDENPLSILSIVDSHEAKMSAEEKAKMEETVAFTIITQDNNLNKMPPKWLAERYVALAQSIAKETNEEKKHELQELRNRIEGRIDDLTDMVASGEHSGDDLWFVDPTNAADVYEGYQEMLTVRLNELKVDENTSEEDKAEIEKRRETIGKAQEITNKEIAEYDEVFGLSNIKEKDASKLSDNFDKLNDALNKAEISPETLKLVSNFRFLDENGQPEPQFEKNGQPVLEYVEGATIRKDSKLEKTVLLAKQEVIKQHLTDEEKPSDKDLAQELSEQLTEELYIFHVNDEVQKGVAENAEQYTDPAYREQFLAKLANIDRPMEISHKTFDYTVDALCNMNASYAKRLDTKLGGKSSEVARKTLKTLAPVDKMASSRMENKASPKEWRKKMALNIVKSGASAFAVSAGITILSAGTNRIAGAAVGVGLGVCMAVNNVIKWRKNRKEAGQPTGLRAFVKDKQMLATIATTSLGAAALGFAATGNPDVASLCGIAALSIGTVNGVVQTWKSGNEAGISGWEKFGWSALQAVVNIGAAYGGRAFANAAVDYVNKNTESNLFKHLEEKVIKDPDKVEVTYKDGVVDRAQETLGKWYKGHEDLLQQRVDEINAYNAEHGTNINPYRYLLAAHDAGAVAPDNMLLHSQTGADVYSNGNHMVLGQRWSNTTGIGQDMVGNLANSVSPNGSINITPESLSAFNQIDSHIGMYNQVGSVVNAPIQNDGVLDFNASMENGQYMQNPNGNVYTTYANTDGVFQEIHTPQSHIETQFVANEINPGLGMFGIVGDRSPIDKLRDRIGALKDRIRGIRKKQEDVIITPPPGPEPTPPPEPEPEPTPEPDPKPEKDTLMIDEYQIVYGIKPSDKSYQDYYQRVEQERLKEAPEKSMSQYLLDRREKFDDIVMKTTDTRLKADYMQHKTRVINEQEQVDYKARGHAEIVGKARRSLMESNLTPENFNGAITLTHFGKYMDLYVTADEAVADGSRRAELNPQYKDKAKKVGSESVMTDLNAYLVGGKDLKDCQKSVPSRELRERQQKMALKYKRQSGRDK